MKKKRLPVQKQIRSVVTPKEFGGSFIQAEEAKEEGPQLSFSQTMAALQTRPVARTQRQSMVQEMAQQYGNKQIQRIVNSLRSTSSLSSEDQPGSKPSQVEPKRASSLDPVEEESGKQKRSELEVQRTGTVTEPVSGPAAEKQIVSRIGGAVAGPVLPPRPRATGVLTPLPVHNFPGRGRSKVYLAERINLSFNSAQTAAAMQGLDWVLQSGGGAVTANGANTGLATFDAPAVPGQVVLELRVASGPYTGRVVSRHSLRVRKPTVKGRLTPQDNFTLRSGSRYGVGEKVDLSFRSSHTAAGVNGLQWVAAGGGTITPNGANTGLATFDAPDTAVAVTLTLQIATGLAAGTILSTHNRTIVRPSNAVMSQQPGTGIRHTHGRASVGFKGQIHFRPRNVSFHFMQFREGSAPAVATGFVASANGTVHATTAAPVSVSTGSITRGSRMIGNDTVDTGDNAPPFSVGSFLWPIPWEYSVNGGGWHQFTTANHRESYTASGRATIDKKGGGPFSKRANDATSGF